MGGMMSFEVSEEELVKAAQGGEREAMEVLFFRYRDAIFRYLLVMLQDEEAAADLTQETFLRAFHALPRLRKPRAFRGWLYRIAANLAHDERRRPTLPTVSWEDMVSDDDPHPGGEEPEGLWLRKERHRAVREALGQLPQEQREVVILYYSQGLALQEIARILGVPKGTVASRLMRARQRLRALLAPWLEEEEE